jgi:hypothetical protein
MKAPSNSRIEQLLRDPKAREQFRRQVKAGTGMSSSGRQTIAVDAPNGESTVLLNIVPARVPF